jgi:pimeloyl-ACP methyl ester carboxylesterase
MSERAQERHGVANAPGGPGGRGVRGLVLGCALAVLGGCGSSELPMLAQFEPTACRHELQPGSTTECGYLLVPEGRSAPDSGRWLRLYVAIYRSLDGRRDQSPLLYLIGGPGASTAGAYAVFEDTSAGNYFRHHFGGTRDIIVLDQRGTNYSNPALYCSRELGPLRSEVYGMAFADAATLRIQALAACYGRLQDEGVNLSAYDSLEIATDVRDMALILGHERFVLYGASYGTRVVMLTMKHYPERVETAILDSILPPEINPYEEEPAAVLHSFRAFFDAAMARYPDLEAHFYAMTNAVQAAPVRVVGHHYDDAGTATDAIPVTVTGETFIAFLAGNLKLTPYDSGLPKRIEGMFATGDYGLVADAWISYLDFFFPAGEAGSGAPSVGLYNSVFSAEDAYYTSPARVRQKIQESGANDAIAAYLEGHFIRMEPAVQGVWPVAPLSSREKDPVASSIPTLMLAGTLDNATPETFSRPSATLLTESVYVTVLAGHATAYLECVTRMIRDFMADPTVAPANSCPAAYAWD